MKAAINNPFPQITNPSILAWLDIGDNCTGCGAVVGQPHRDCDQARCLYTGYQRAACQRVGPVAGQEPHDCGTDLWPGIDPDSRDAIALGLFTTPTGDPARVAADHAEAIPDVDRLPSEAVWNPKTGRWQKK